MRTSVSVIIPMLDSPVVRGTIEALARQAVPGPGVELIVVGRDGHGQLPTDSPLCYLETPEPYPPAKARNLGVEASHGRNLLFIDSDCLPQPGWSLKLAAALKHTPVAGGSVTFPRSSNRWALADNIASFHALLGDRPAERTSVGPLGSLNLGVTREAWEKVGPFDESLVTSEDLDWVLRARGLGLATAFVPEAVVEHAAVRASPASLTAHAAWYGNHFHSFSRRHPGFFDRGPTWKSRRRLALWAPLKALTSALSIFLRHPQLVPCLHALPGVVLFKYAWYRAVLDTWPEGDGAGP